ARRCGSRARTAARAAPPRAAASRWAAHWYVRRAPSRTSPDGEQRTPGAPPQRARADLDDQPLGLDARQLLARPQHGALHDLGLAADLAPRCRRVGAADRDAGRRHRVAATAHCDQAQCGVEVVELVAVVNEAQVRTASSARHGCSSTALGCAGTVTVLP